MSDYTKIGELACQMAEALQTEIDGDHDKAVNMMSRVFDEGQPLNDDRFILLYDGMNEAMGWAHFCDRHKLGYGGSR